MCYSVEKAPTVPLTCLIWSTEGLHSFTFWESREQRTEARTGGGCCSCCPSPSPQEFYSSFKAGVLPSPSVCQYHTPFLFFRHYSNYLSSLCFYFLSFWLLFHLYPFCFSFHVLLFSICLILSGYRCHRYDLVVVVASAELDEVTSVNILS